MNLFKKVYCRVFQGGMRLAIPLLPYREPVIINSIEEVPALLQQKRSIVYYWSQIRPFVTLG